MKVAGGRGKLLFLTFSTVFFLSYSSLPCDAAEPPDLEANPVTQRIESVDVSAEDGSRVRHVEDPGQSEAAVETILSSSPAVSARIAIDADGKSWAVWQDAATNQIRFSVRDPIGGEWRPETLLSESGQVCASPRVAPEGSRGWIAYEVREGPLTSLTASIIEDGAEPVLSRMVVAETYFTGALDLDLRSEGGRVWMSWIASATDLEWSRFDAESGAFTAPAVEPLAGGSAGDARQRIRARVLAM